jgi:hypothetical protein
MKSASWTSDTGYFELPGLAPACRSNAQDLELGLEALARFAEDDVG